MSRQVHFVVAVDVDEEKLYIDDETYTARFSDNEVVWNTETNEWQEDINNTYYEKALRIFNTKRAEDD